MTTLREAAQQALEALEWSWGGEPMGTLERDAITALRAALAEPVQEPVACVRIHKLLAWIIDECVVYPESPDEKAFAKRLLDAITHPKSGLNAPPQRKPLMDEEIRDLWSWSMTAEAERTATTQQHAFARAIERAHGIGEKK